MHECLCVDAEIHDIDWYTIQGWNFRKIFWMDLNHNQDTVVTEDEYLQGYPYLIGVPFFFCLGVIDLTHFKNIIQNRYYNSFYIL